MSISWYFMSFGFNLSLFKVENNFSDQLFRLVELQSVMQHTELVN